VHIVDTLLGPMALPGRARRSVALVAGLTLGAFAGAGVAAGGIPTLVECAQIVAYTAPDPVMPADGSLTIGLLPAWTIASDAEVGAQAASILPSFAGSGPSCVELQLDTDDQVTALDFAPSGSVSGDVVVDTDSGWYLFADRLIVPTFITDSYPGLAAVFATSAAAGTPVSASFTVDVTSGAFTDVFASASFCGPADVDADGNGLVGDAIIPAAVLDLDSTDALERADGHIRCADVETEGTVGQQLQLTTSVSITNPGPAASPPDTATGSAPTDIDGAPGWGLVLWFAALVVMAFGVLVRRPARARVTSAAEPTPSTEIT
jgi:hypothetical protein